MFGVTYITGDTVKTHAHSFADVVYISFSCTTQLSRKPELGVNPCIIYQPIYLSIQPHIFYLSPIYPTIYSSIINPSTL